MSPLKQKQNQITKELLDEAVEYLKPLIETTPVQSSRAFSKIAGQTVTLKCENLQRTGSFKIRGAAVRLSRLSDAEKQKGVIAASAGNHAQGVALAAAHLGIESVVYMPATAPLPKIEATRSYGAKVRLIGNHFEEALVAAKAESEQTGKVFIHPYDHVDVMAGQGTLVAEIIAQVPDVKHIIVPVGGGGLMAGMVAAGKILAPQVEIIGVQAERMAPFPPSLAEGELLTVPFQGTMADGISVATPGIKPFEILHQARSRVVTVSEDEISQAVLMVSERAKLLVEPAGVTGIAALIAASKHDNLELRGPTVVLLSGGNIDPTVLLRVVRHGLSSAGRFLQVRVRLIDRPGALADLMLDLATVGGNVMHVEHVRTGPHLAIDEVEVIAQVETKGLEHCDRLLSHLREKGYRLDN